jgi:hypothetical protein
VCQTFATSLWERTLCATVQRAQLAPSTSSIDADSKLMLAARLISTEAACVAHRVRSHNVCFAGRLMFSTTRVDSSCISLWTTACHGFDDNDLRHRADVLPSGVDVFHSVCGCHSRKPVDKQRNSLLRKAVITR